MPNDIPEVLTVRLSVVVQINPDDEELLERVAEGRGLTPKEVVGSEVETNLRSLDYVHQVDVEVLK